MELRLATSRTTRDIDLMTRQRPEGEETLSGWLLQHLQEAASA